MSIPTHPSGNPLADKKSVVLISVVSGICGIAGTFAAMSWSRLVAALLIIVAVLPWLISLPFWVNWRGWQWVLAAAISTSAATGAIFAIYRADHPAPPPVSPTKSPETSPTAGPVGHALYPLSEHDDKPMTVARCMPMAGRVERMPRGASIVVGTSSADGDLYFKKADHQPDSEGYWYGEKTIGASKQPGLFRVVEFLVSADIAQQVDGTHNSELPGGAEVLASFTVLRGDQEEPACDEAYVRASPSVS
ncbi:hypothetical protein [Catellatospora sp. NPDC049609]|uniref:hypothetical protein n=1 Tax=Catellatospora sp. NPDC049609 TaxID=3155505 RepID=UPI003435A749